MVPKEHNTFTNTNEIICEKVINRISFIIEMNLIRVFNIFICIAIVLLRFLGRLKWNLKEIVNLKIPYRKGKKTGVNP